ncbi:MAG TPA: DUF5947 family protein [Candidatus Baltobacteraceae bacterium]|jgi:hypothetical protein
MQPPLARFLGERKAPVPGELCELCATPLFEAHSHLVDANARRLLCACRPCYLLFTPKGAAQGRYKPVPERYVELGVELTGAQWDELQIPISLAFFFFTAESEKLTAFYPGPSGATESLLPLDVWDRLFKHDPVLATMEADVEALLVARDRGGGGRALLVPIDACYELVGLIRKTWKGFDGGEDAHAAIDAFFERLRERSTGMVTEARR